MNVRYRGVSEGRVPPGAPGTPGESGVSVMHVITGLETGGAETVLIRLVLAQRSSSFPQFVVSLTDDGDYGPRLREAGIPVESLGMRRGRADISGVLRLAKLIRQYRPTVIQSWMYHADLLALFALAISGRRRQTRLYWGIRAANMAFEEYGPMLRLTFKLCARLSTFPDGVVVNSVSGLNHHTTQGYRARQFALIPNGVDCQYFAPMPEVREETRAKLELTNGRVVAAHIARVDPMKDHATLLAALDRAPTVTVLAVGAGTERLPAHANLIPLGPVKDVRSILSAADMIVSSSIGEGFPNAVAEGMAMALPVVATDVGDVAALVGKAGSIVNAQDPDQLANAMIRLAEDPGRRRALGKAARQRILRNFSLDQMVRRFDHLHLTGRPLVPDQSS